MLNRFKTNTALCLHAALSILVSASAGHLNAQTAATLTIDASTTTNTNIVRPERYDNEQTHFFDPTVFELAINYGGNIAHSHHNLIQMVPIPLPRGHRSTRHCRPISKISILVSTPCQLLLYARPMTIAATKANMKTL